MIAGWFDKEFAQLASQASAEAWILVNACCHLLHMSGQGGYLVAVRGCGRSFVLEKARGGRARAVRIDPGLVRGGQVGRRPAVL